jgi:hypothetical protein
LFKANSINVGWDFNLHREDEQAMHQLSQAVGFEDISAEALSDAIVPVQVALYAQFFGGTAYQPIVLRTVKDMTPGPSMHDLSGSEGNSKFWLYLRNRLSHTAICGFDVDAAHNNAPANPGHGWSNSSVVLYRHNGRYENDLSKHRVSRRSMRLKPVEYVTQYGEKKTSFDLFFRAPIGLTYGADITFQFFRLMQGEHDYSTGGSYGKFGARLNLSAAFENKAEVLSSLSADLKSPRTPEELLNMRSQYPNLVVEQTEMKVSMAWIVQHSTLPNYHRWMETVDESDLTAAEVDLFTGERRRPSDNKALPLRTRVHLAEHPDFSTDFFKEGFQYAVRANIHKPLTDKDESHWGELSTLVEGHGFLLKSLPQVEDLSVGPLVAGLDDGSKIPLRWRLDNTAGEAKKLEVYAVQLANATSLEELLHSTTS